jgi:hypothetical protein
MTKQELEAIRQIGQTVEGCPISDLRYKPIDNILVGLVKSPNFGNPKLYEGQICVTWTTRGKTTTKYKGIRELDLKMPVYVEQTT